MTHIMRKPALQFELHATKKVSDLYYSAVDENANEHTVLDAYLYEQSIGGLTRLANQIELSIFLDQIRLKHVQNEISQLMDKAIEENPIPQKILEELHANV
jgi:hypothetical protein